MIITLTPIIGYQQHHKHFALNKKDI